jgi:small-conductance mechanosensitive channel
MHKHTWRHANARLIPCARLLAGGAALSTVYGNVRHGDLDHKLIALSGVCIFVIFAIGFLNVLSNAVREIIVFYDLISGRAASIPFILRLLGYITILLSTLELLGISVERLLLGGAVLGIILGVAAQQALANFFASIVLVISHPFSVGENITLTSGALGGKYTGKVMYIGLTHTRMKDTEGNTIYLPNATILSSATIMAQRRKKVITTDEPQSTT